MVILTGILETITVILAIHLQSLTIPGPSTQDPLHRNGPWLSLASPGLYEAHWQ